MSRFSDMRHSRNQYPGGYHDKVQLEGLQSRALIAGLDHPVWEVVTAQGAKDAEDERRFGDLEVDVDTILRLEADDGAAFREFGSAFLRIVDQHEGGGSLEIDLENSDH